MARQTAEPQRRASPGPARDSGARHPKERTPRTVKDAVDYIVRTHKGVLKELEKH